MSRHSDDEKSTRRTRSSTPPDRHEEERRTPRIYTEEIEVRLSPQLLC